MCLPAIVTTIYYLAYPKAYITTGLVLKDIYFGQIYQFQQIAIIGLVLTDM